MHDRDNSYQQNKGERKFSEVFLRNVDQYFLSDPRAKQTDYKQERNILQFFCVNVTVVVIDNSSGEINSKINQS